MRAARSWSSQKPAAPIWASSSARRAASASGSKVITDPREAGSDLLELLAQRLVVLLGHAAMLPPAAVGLAPHKRFERARGADLEGEVDAAADRGLDAQHLVGPLGHARARRRPIGRVANCDSVPARASKQEGHRR